MGVDVLPSGKWRGRVKINGENHSDVFVTRAAAEDFVRQLKSQKDNHQLPDPSKAKRTTTVEQWSRVYIKTLQTGPGSGSNKRNHEANVRLYINPMIGHKRIADVTGEDIHDIVADAWEQVSKDKAQAVCRTMSALFNRAIDADLLVRNPYRAKLHMPKGSSRDRRPTLTTAEAPVLLAAFEETWAREIATCLLALGCRQGELWALMPHDVDPDRWTVHFRHTVGPTEMGQLKTVGSERTVGIPAVLRPIFQRQLDMVERHGDMTYTPTINGKITDHKERLRYRWLFQNAAGSFIHRDNFRERQWKPAYAASGIVKHVPMTLHDLRHTYVTWNIQKLKESDRAGALPRIAAWIGDDEKTVRKTYAHVLDGLDAHESTEVMDDVFAGLVPDPEPEPGLRLVV